MKDVVVSERILSDEMIAAIEVYFRIYPTRQAVTLPALHVVNDRLGYVPPRAVVEIAELLGLPPASVQDTLSFYGYFKQDRPHGRTRVWVCRSLSCALRGGHELLERLSGKAGIRPGETTTDGRLTLEHGECLGACEHAPCLLANNRLHKCVTDEQADALLESWLRDETPVER